MPQPVLYSTQQLHGMYYAPAQPCNTVLLLSPLFEEKRCAHRAMACCATALADAGATVLHIDLTGTGNSRGALAEIGLACWLDDIHAALEWLHERTTTPLTIIACRAGALLAMQLCTAELATTRLILVQPVLSGHNYLQQVRTRRMIQDQITGKTPPNVEKHEVEGQLLSAELYNELQQLRTPAIPPGNEVHLLQCSFQEKLLGEYEQQLASWDSSRVHTRAIICEPFWYPHSPGSYTELTRVVVEEALT